MRRNASSQWPHSVRFGAQELAPRRRVEVQLLRRRPSCRRRAPRARSAPTVPPSTSMRHACGLPAARDASAKPRHRGDRRQRLAAKAERRDRLEVVSGRDLRRRVARHRERQVLARDAAAVVGDADALDAAVLEVDVDLRGAGVERVLEQLLQRRRRPLDDFAGGDLVDEQVGQRPDRRPSAASVGEPAAPSARRRRRRPRSARRARASRSPQDRPRSADARVERARQLVGASAAPGLDQLARHLDVALEADVAIVDHVSPGSR